jgi:hypothetical protein
MDIAPTAKPVPLPIPTSPLTREQVASRPLVSFTVTNSRGTRTQIAMSVPRMSMANTAKGDAFERANASVNKVVVLRGSFQDAVRAANALVRTSDAGPGHASYNGRQAHAVVDAGEGVWHLTALGNGRQIAWIDPLPGIPMVVDDVLPMDPSVKAVVGAHTWVNFSDEAFDPKFDA